MPIRVGWQGADKMITDTNKRLFAHGAALGTILIWGTTFISTKVLLRSFSPIEILFTRFVLGYFALLLFYPHRMKRKSFRTELMFAAAGLSGVTLYFLFENIALTYTLASNVGIIVPIAPLFTAVLAHFFLKGERLKPQFLFGFLIAFLGIVLIGLNGGLVLKLNPLGDLLAALAALVWGVYSVLMKKITALDLNPVGTTRKVFGYGLLFMIPALFLLGFSPEPRHYLEMKNILNFLFLGLGASALCFVSWTWTVGILGAVKTSIYIYIVPVVTILSAALILHEKITPLTFGGAILTMSGLYISERKGKALKRA